MAFAQERPITNYTPDSETLALPSAMVTHIYQDTQGFIWFSVFSSGLVRYDGTRMLLFDTEDGLRDLGIWQMIEDTSGHLWVASNNGLVVSELPLDAYSHRKKIRFTAEHNGTPLLSDAFKKNQIAADSAGGLWVGTSDAGLIRYSFDEESLLRSRTFSTNMSGEEELSVNSVYAGTSDNIWVSLEGGSIYRLSEGKMHLFYSPATPGSDAEINSLYEDDESKIWAYKQNGEILLFDTLSSAPEVIQKKSSTNITGLLSLSDGYIWTTNGANGITLFDKQSGTVVDTFTRVNGLLSENVFHVTEDREGNIWIAQSGGVSKLKYNYRAFENFSARSNSGETPVLPSAHVNTTLVSDNESFPCRVWVGTEGGATCIKKDGSSDYITQAEGLTGNWVNGLVTDSSERIWVATTQGLNGIAFNIDSMTPGSENLRNITVDDQEAWVFSIPDSPPFIAAEQLKMAQTNDRPSFSTFWFPGLRSIYGVVNDTIYQFDMENGLPQTLYKSVAYDDKGYLWIGTLDRGIYKSTIPLNPDRLDSLHSSQPDSSLFRMYWSEENGAPTNHIEKLVWHRGNMWIGTQSGLIAIDPQTREISHHITQANGLPADNAVSFDVSVRTGNIWVGTNQGLAEVNPANGNILKTVTLQDGLIDNEVWLYGSVKVDNDGSVYYGTANGLSIYHPHYDKTNEVPPLAHLVAFNLSYPAEGRNEVTFDYAATSFGNSPQVRYSARLLGYNNEWSPESSDVRLRYTNLPAIFFSKEYTFEVVSVNESGVRSAEPASFSFSIQPVWWLQWWAFLIYLIVLGGLVFSVDRIQRKRVIKKERNAARLREAELKAETADAQARVLKSENEKKAVELEKARELGIAYHELKATQNQLIQSEKMASLGRLSTGIAHEIKNPLNFINNFAEVSNEMVNELKSAILSDDQDEIQFLIDSLKHNTQKIEEHGKRADSIVHSMMQHARGGKATFEMMNVNDMLQNYADLAYNGKRSKIPDFHTTVETDYDPKIQKIKVMPQEIGQVFLNIIGNSLDAVWENSKLQGDDYQPTVKITTQQLGDEIEIKISDNGPGIPDELKEKIFEPFFTTKPTGEGTGLGLSLSYDIVTQGHNGSLLLESQKGKGAMFIIKLPASSEMHEEE